MSMQFTQSTGRYIAVLRHRKENYLTLCWVTKPGVAVTQPCFAAALALNDDGEPQPIQNWYPAGKLNTELVRVFEEPAMPQRDGVYLFRTRTEMKYVELLEGVLYLDGREYTPEGEIHSSDQLLTFVGPLPEERKEQLQF